MMETTAYIDITETDLDMERLTSFLKTNNIKYDDISEGDDGSLRVYFYGGDTINRLIIAETVIGGLVQ